MIEAWAEFTTEHKEPARVRRKSVTQIVRDGSHTIIVSPGCEDLRVIDPFERVCFIISGTTSLVESDA